MNIGMEDKLMRREINIGTLDNGLTVYSQPDSTRSSHLWGVGVKAGSFHDPKDKRGIAHLAEHLMCAESLKYSNEEVDLLFERITGGPENNLGICTTRYCTFYGPVDFLRHRHSMETFFDLVVGMLRDRIITPNNTSVERAAVHNEYYLRGYHDLEDTLYDLVHKGLYRKNPARHSVDGSISSIRGITRKDIGEFVETYYVPSNMFVIFLGPRYHEAMQLANKYFGDWNPETHNYRTMDFSEYTDDIVPNLVTPRTVEIERAGIMQHYRAIGFPTETYVSKDAEAIEVLGRILAFRIRRRLRDDNKNFDKGVYRALAFTERTFLHGVLYFWFASIDEGFANYGEEVVLEECRKMRESLVRPEEWDPITKNLYQQYRDMMVEYPSELAEAITASACNGDEDLKMLLSSRDRMKKMSRTRLRNVANKYLTDGYARAIITPA